MPEQVQDFIRHRLHCLPACIIPDWIRVPWRKCTHPHNPHEKAMQRALIQYRNPKNYELVKEALIISPHIRSGSVSIKKAPDPSEGDALGGMEFC